MDRGLVEQARKGDRAAFERLAFALSDGLYAIATRILRDPDAAGDALQVALVTIWRDLPTLRDADRFEAWAHRVLINRCYQHLRRAKRWPRPIEITAEPAAGHDTELVVGAPDELQRSFGRLSPDHRAVLVLHYLHDRKLEEIASWLGISEGTVKSRLHHAREALRAAIDADARPVQQERPTA